MIARIEHEIGDTAEIEGREYTCEAYDGKGNPCRRCDLYERWGFSDGTCGVCKLHVICHPDWRNDDTQVIFRQVPDYVDDPETHPGFRDEQDYIDWKYR